jgi:hypothetical protein
VSAAQTGGPGDLNVDPELVRAIVAHARAALFEVPDAEADEVEEEMELDAATAVEREDAAHLHYEDGPDGTRAETAAMIDSLNVDEQAELVALTWIGRGDYDPSELSTAVQEAKERATGPASTTLFEIDAFPSHMANGLSAYEDWLARQPG